MKRVHRIRFSGSSDDLAHDADGVLNAGLDRNQLRKRKFANRFVRADIELGERSTFDAQLFGDIKRRDLADGARFIDNQIAAAKA